MFKKFLPQETDFFVMFEKAVLNVNKGASLLVEMMGDLDIAAIKAKEIYEVEQEGDMLTHELMRKLNKQAREQGRQDIQRGACQTL